MDWARAIERNSEALRAIVAALYAMLGLAAGAALAPATRIPRGLHAQVLRVLRPAESAVRRLIVIAARGLVVKLPPARPKPTGPIKRGGGGRASFRLFDTRKRFTLAPRRAGKRVAPRVVFLWGDPHLSPLFWSRNPPAAIAAPPPDDGKVDAGRLSLRLQVLKAALDDLPRQAQRLARWRLRRERMPNPKFTSPLRPGPPPGRRKRPTHEVDEVLIECHGLAFDVLTHNTS